MDPENEISSNHYRSSAFNQLVVYPTLAPHLVPRHVKDATPTTLTHALPTSGSAIEPSRVFGTTITNSATTGQDATSEHAATPLGDQDVQPRHVVKQYLTSITMSCLQADATTIPVRGGKAKVKKVSTTKHVCLALEGMTRAQFLTDALQAHGLINEYKPEFPCRLWWTGSPGGQKQASSIEKDDEFNIALQSIMKKASTCTVSVAYDLDTMSAFRKNKRPLALVEDGDVASTSDELTEGSKVPRLENYSSSKKWKCQKHTGEHGEPGYCYIKADGQHFGLNTRQLGTWSAAIADGVTTVERPPNCELFEQALTLDHTALSRPRGKTRPHPRHSTPLTTEQPTSGLDMNMINALIAAAVLPMVSQLNQDQGCPVAATSLASSTIVAPPPSSSVVSRELVEELQNMLEAFHLETDINIVHHADLLAELSFKPRVIAVLPVVRVSEVLGLREGEAFELQGFAKAWLDRKNDKARI
ncbi:hypothetical protein BU15DRAFT_59952 [Melanogaster broomeanus]|nr:hypothetical protein BU15DRAFT_59952 [Melanogaster broomeanus]